MSNERVLQNKKHGGAHELTHEINENGEISLSGQYIITQDFIKHDNTDPGCGKFQDGGQKDSDNVVHGDITDNLHFLTDELDSYDQEVVENNTEWLKSRCKNLDQVDFDISSSSAGEDNLGFPTISIENKSLLQCDQRSQFGRDDISQMCEATDCPLTITDSVVSSSQQTILEASQTTVMQGQLENSYLVSMDTDLPVLSSATAGEISIENLFTSADKGKGLGIDISADCNKKKGDQIISGLENTLAANALNGAINPNFKFSLKDGMLTLVPVEDQFVAPDLVKGDVTQVDNQNVENLRATPSVIDPSVTLAGHGFDGQAVSLVNSLGGAVQQINGQTVTQPNSQAFATISIQTDKLANSTKILVDTSQGRQVYQLNISDLTGAPGNANIVPNTTPTPVSNPQSVQVIPSQKPDEPQAVKMVPGYVILAVQNPETNEPNLSTSVVASKSDQSPSKKKKRGQIFICNHIGCGKFFNTMGKLTVHTMSHTGERPYKCSEPDCEWTFSKAYKLKRHEESHKGSRDHTCKFCNKKFTTIYNLKSHLKQHQEPCNEECPVETCNRKFRTRRELDRHLKTHEGIEKTYKCPFEGCEKLFLSPHCLGSHPRVHMGEPVDLTCQFDGCGRKFDKLCRLKQHQRSHTGERPYVCHFSGCNWAFSTASKLTRHMTKHTNRRKWICKECGKAFLRAEHLKGHMITHTGIKPFTCPVEGCGQKFVAKSSVYIHLKKHDTTEKEITYHCPMENCDKKYGNKAKLRQHIVKHFPGTLSPEDAAQLDIVPLLKNESRESEDEVVVQPRTVSVKTQPDGKMKIDPIEFMATKVGKEGEVKNTSVANQFTAQLTAELNNMMAANNVQPVVTTTSTTSSSSSSSSTTKAAIRKESSEHTGSARTDYHSNMMLSDRAKKRRKMLREMAEGNSMPSDESMEIQNTPPPTSLHDNMSSHGITFRDPETGVMYVQTQLLQDDPPHPDLYAEDNVLNGELSLHNESDSESDHDEQFVGSTINLQDLVG